MQNRNNIEIMSVNEACTILNQILRDVSVEPFDIDIANTLCEIEFLQNILEDLSNEVISAESIWSDLKDRRDKLSNDLCVNLMAWIASGKFSDVRRVAEEKSLEEILHGVALTLAKINPANAIDFATQEEILPENQIVTSDRFQHDINSLQAWLRQKNTNPWTNLKFSRRDIEFIKLNFQLRKPDDAIDIYEGNPYPGGDPNLAATMELARTLQPAAAPHRFDFDVGEFFWGDTNDVIYLELPAGDRPDAPQFHGDFERFPDVRYSAPFYWPTVQQLNPPVIAANANHAIHFKEKIDFFLAHHTEWVITDTVDYIMSEIFPAYTQAPIEIKLIHDEYTLVVMQQLSVNFFLHMPAPVLFREQVEEERRTQGLMFSANSQTRIHMHQIVGEYARKLVPVAANIDMYIQNHFNHGFRRNIRA